MKERDPTAKDMEMISQINWMKFQSYSTDVSDTSTERDYSLYFHVNINGKDYIIHTAWITMQELEEGEINEY